MLLPCVEIATAMLVALLLATAVHGQEYPQRPIRLVTSEPGGSTDFVARIVAQGIMTPMGQPVIVDNRGGGGSISGEIVTHAAPDGYTVLVTGSSFWGAPLFRKTTYDPVRGFTPISFIRISAASCFSSGVVVPTNMMKSLVICLNYHVYAGLWQVSCLCLLDCILALPIEEYRLSLQTLASGRQQP